MTELVALITLNLPAAICLVVGIILVAIEIFIPGFGLPGIAGILLLIVGVVLGASSLLEALVLILIILVILGLLTAIAMRSYTKGRLSRTPLVLHTELDHEAGFSSTKDMEYFIGRKGVTLTPLRPAGIADFDGVKLDVVSDSAFVEKGTPIQVTNVEGRRIVVTSYTPEPDSQSSASDA